MKRYIKSTPINTELHNQELHELADEISAALPGSDTTYHENNNIVIATKCDMSKIANILIEEIGFNFVSDDSDGIYLEKQDHLYTAWIWSDGVNGNKITLR